MDRDVNIRKGTLGKLWIRSYIFVTFAPAEFENSCIVAHKGDTFGGVAGLGAEVARLDPVTWI